MRRSRRRASTSRCASGGRTSRRPPRPEPSGALAYAGDDTTRAILRRSAELDAIQLALLAEVAAPGTDLSVVYLPGLDIAQHALLGSDQAGLAASTLAARLDAVKAYYSTLDRLLAPFLTPAADELVILVTEPGRVGEHGAARLSARGAAVRPHDVSSSAATAVTPTVLYALGIPIARDLPSAPLLELFDPQFTARYPVRHVATYGRPSAAPAVAHRTAARSGDDRSIEEPGVREVSGGDSSRSQSKSADSPLRTPRSAEQALRI